MRLAIIFDKLTTFLQYYIVLGGPLASILISLFFVSYTISDFLIFLVAHFIMVTCLSFSYHRYFAHKTFDVNRVTQFLIGLIGTLCLHRGPVWWASIHRLHHQACGTERDPHSPSKGFWTSHFLWLNIPQNRGIQWKYVQDLLKFPELLFLEYVYLIHIPLISFLCYYYGGIQAMFAYHLAVTTSLNTIAAVNSVCHENADEDCAAKNVSWVAFWGAGEGFHANHHDHPGSAFFGTKWYHFDLSYLLIKLLGLLGIVKNIRVKRDVS